MNMVGSLEESFLKIIADMAQQEERTVVDVDAYDV